MIGETRTRDEAMDARYGSGADQRGLSGGGVGGGFGGEEALLAAASWAHQRQRQQLLQQQQLEFQMHQQTQPSTAGYGYQYEQQHHQHQQQDRRQCDESEVDVTGGVDDVGGGGAPPGEHDDDDEEDEGGSVVGGGTVNDNADPWQQQPPSRAEADAPSAAAPSAEGCEGGEERASYGINSRRSAEWSARLDQLLAYKAEHGDCRVPKDYPVNPSLASWCDNQRRQRKLRAEGKKSSMTDERESALNAAGFWWGWRLVPFEDRVEELRRYRDEHGSCKISNAHGGTKYNGLRDWLKAQRERFHDGRLDADRRAVLEEIGVEFGARLPKWEDYYAELVKYKEKFGDCNLSKAAGEEYSDLWKWAKRQRAAYTARMTGSKPREALSDERLAKLKEVGFLFSVWDVRFSELVRYKEKHGKLPDLPSNLDSARRFARRDEVEDGDLIRWLANQRKNFTLWQERKDCPLTDERVIRLLKIDFNFRPPKANRKDAVNSKLIVDSVWKKQLGALKAFKDIFGHVDVPSSFGMNRELVRWVDQQRTDYRAMKGDDEGSPMTEQRFEELKALGFSFTTEDVHWNDKLRDLVAFNAKNGTSFIASNDKKNAGLYLWVKEQRRQRQAFDAGEEVALTPERIAALEEASFPWEDEPPPVKENEGSEGDCTDSRTGKKRLEDTPKRGRSSRTSLEKISNSEAAPPTNEEKERGRTRGSAEPPSVKEEEGSEGESAASRTGKKNNPTDTAKRGRSRRTSPTKRNNDTEATPTDEEKERSRTRGSAKPRSVNEGKGSEGEGTANKCGKQKPTDTPRRGRSRRTSPAKGTDGEATPPTEQRKRGRTKGLAELPSVKEEEGSDSEGAANRDGKKKKPTDTPRRGRSSRISPAKRTNDGEAPPVNEGKKKGRTKGSDKSSVKEEEGLEGESTSRRAGKKNSTDTTIRGRYSRTSVAKRTVSVEAPPTDEEKERGRTRGVALKSSKEKSEEGVNAAPTKLTSGRKRGQPRKVFPVKKDDANVTVSTSSAKRQVRQKGKAAAAERKMPKRAASRGRSPAAKKRRSSRS